LQKLQKNYKKTTHLISKENSKSLLVKDFEGFLAVKTPFAHFWQCWQATWEPTQLYHWFTL